MMKGSLMATMAIKRRPAGKMARCIIAVLPRVILHHPRGLNGLDQRGPVDAGRSSSSNCCQRAMAWE